MEENKAFDFGVKDGKLEFGIDPNRDGQNVISGKLHLGEALSEAFSRGEKVPGARIVDVKFELTRLVVKLDTDKDGEPLLELEIDLAEAFDEVQDALGKDGSAPSA